ncbi:hypothetical protein [Cutibacterium sp.]|uniref:hypothetical protein n=1 Tax=Cutibacterium sp. TaxID=1912221 RepID=UPI0026DC1C4C|nr:hypothetical protein [Cutibacterium sp.]MDO4412574.1 hypothetical protein [Cutibacterium sp.]
MFGSRKSKDELLANLRDVDLKLAALPSQTKENIQAQEVIERLKADGVPVEKINIELARNDLPSVDEVGKNTAASLFPTWKLNRQRRKLEKQLSKFD